MRRARAAALFFLVGAVVVGVGGAAPAASASTVPQITSTTAVPATVTTGSPVELEWQFLGDLSGYASSLQLVGPGGASIPTCASTTPVLVSGWMQAGTLAVTCTVPIGTPVGTWSTTVRMERMSDQQVVSAAGPSFVVLEGQAVTFTSTPPSPASASGPSYTVSAQASSGLGVTLTLDRDSLGCSLVGDVVSFSYAALCIVDADQTGDATYAPAPEVQQQITVVGSPSLTPPVLTGSTTDPTTVTAGGTIAITWTWTSSVGIGGATLAATGPGGSTLPCNGQPATVTTGAVSGTTELDCAVPSTAANGAWTITFQLIDTSEHVSDTTVDGFTVQGGPLLSQTVSFTSSAPSAITLDEGTYVPTATASSGLTVAIGLDADSTGCTMSGGVVSFVGAGTCVIDADQAGDPDVAPAAQVQQSITVTRASQSIAFTSDAPATVSAGGPDYTPTATASSGLTVAIGLDADSTGCTMSRGVVSFVGAGTCVIDADQAGDATFAAAPQVQQSIDITDPPATTGPLGGQVVGIASLPDGLGYWLVDAAGGVSAHGDAVDYGSMAGQPLNSPIAHIVSTADGRGYWLVAGDGGTFAFGDAGFFGSMGGQHLNAPVVDLAPTADGRGYWLVATDGGIFAFGDAAFHGSMGGRTLNRPVVGIAADDQGGGYWEVASDGGIFAFGAPFFGSTGNLVLDEPILSMAPTSNGQGYWFVASDGGIFAFGDAPYHGSLGGRPITAPIVGMGADPVTGGYWMAGADGSVYSFGAPDFGSH